MFLAKLLVALVAVLNFGGLVADAVWPFGARQHLRNPAWPPHAKFHNAQTMVIGLLAGALSLAILFLAKPLTLPLFLIAAVTAANYFLAMLVAQLFPGVAWCDPEFAAVTPRPLGLAPQHLVSGIACAAVGVAIVMAIVSA